MGRYLRLVYKLGGNFVYFTGKVYSHGCVSQVSICMGSKNRF